MNENVIRIADYERKSRNPDGAAPRDPCDADTIILPVIRRLSAPAPAEGPCITVWPHGA